jgi:hypothetical protein
MIISKMLDPYLTSHAPRKCNTIPMCPQISIHPPDAAALYDLGFSFFSFHSADRPTPETLTTLNRTPGISPFALPLRPKPASRTSSFSSTKLRQPSLGTISHQPLSSSNPSHPQPQKFQSVLNIPRKILCQNSPKAVTFFPFLINCTRTHFRIAELGCLASTPTFSRTIPLA